MVDLTLGHAPITAHQMGPSRCSRGTLFTRLSRPCPRLPQLGGVAQKVLWTRLLDVTPTLWRPRPLPLPCKPRGSLNIHGTDVEAETQRWEVLGI